jgi:hypothetical protein
MARNLTLVQRDEMKARIVERLMVGESMLQITDEKGMPSWSTVWHWMQNDRAWADEISRAREAGFTRLAEAAYLDAMTCEDAVKGRLRLDATRWYLGKLSLAFSDNKVQRHEVDLQLSPEAQAWLGQDVKTG